MQKSNRRPESSTGTAGRTGSNEARRPLRGGYLEILGGLSPCAKLQSTRELLSELRSRLSSVDPHRGQTGNEKSEFCAKNKDLGAISCTVIASQDDEFMRASFFVSSPVARLLCSLGWCCG